MTRTRLQVLAILCASALGATLALGAGPATDAQKIESLVSQLGSSMFMEREAATKALDTIGAPALEALKRTAAGNDPEMRRRAEALVVRIERRVLTELLLKPTSVRLAFKETPLPDAVAEFAKKSGYKVSLSGDVAKYRNRKVTLDTGETSFWKALDQLCAQAGLVEANAVEMPLQPINPQVQPRPVRRLPPQQVLVDPNAPVLLTDGKARDLATHFAGAARVRALPPETQVLGTARAKGEILFALGVAFEQRVPLERIAGVRVEKALDEQGQDLEPAMSSDPAAPMGRPIFIGNGNGNFNGWPVAIIGSGAQQAAVRLKAGDKQSKSLKELTGCVLAEVRTPPEPVMTVEDIFKAVGKSVKGKDGGTLTVLEVVKQDDGQIRIRVDLEPPPENANNGVRGRIGAGAIQIMPVLPVAPVLPVIPPAAPAAPPAQGLQIQIQMQQIGGNGIVIAPAGGFIADPMGLSLVDAKGNTIPLVNTPRRLFKVANNVVSHEITLLFKPQQGQGEPAKLHYTSTRVVSIEIPFMLKDVQIP